MHACNNTHNTQHTTHNIQPAEPVKDRVNKNPQTAGLQSSHWTGLQLFLNSLKTFYPKRSLTWDFKFLLQEN